MMKNTRFTLECTINSNVRQTTAASSLTREMLGHSGLEITSLCKGSPLLEKHFVAVIGAESVKKIKRQRRSNCFWIANTETIKENGAHWYAIISSDDGFWELFDPLGITKDEVKRRLGKVTDADYNISSVQGSDSTNCALFCLWFVYKRYERFDEEFGDVLNACFSEDTDKNEARVMRFYNNIRR